MLFVYLIEENPEFYPRVKQIYLSMTKRQDTVCTSVLTIGEVLVGPEKKGAKDLVSLVLDTIRPPYVELIPFDVKAAARYAKIRAAHAVTPAVPFTWRAPRKVA